MKSSHPLRSLLMPESVALVGASSKPGSIGRIVMENLLAGVFRGRGVRGQSGASAGPRATRVCIGGGDRQAGRPRVDCRARRGRVRRCSRTADVPASRRPSCCPRRPRRRTSCVRWQQDLMAIAKARRHPRARSAFVRRDAHRHRAQCNARRRRGASRPSRAGRAVGGRLHRDARFRRDLPASASRPSSRSAARSTSGSANCSTRCSSTRQPRASSSTRKRSATRGAFLSALRAAARTKPVVVLKAGRSMESGSADGAVARRRLRRRDAARRHRSREDLYAAVRRRTDTGDEPDFARATTRDRRPTATARVRSPPTAPRARHRAGGFFAGDQKGAHRRASAEHRVRESDRTCAVTPRRSGLPRRSTRRFRIRRSTPCSCCTSPRPATARRTRRARWRTSRGGLRSRCWRRGWARSTGARRAPHSRRGVSRTSTRPRMRSTRSRSSRLPAQSGMAARGAAAAARAAAAGSRSWSNAFAPIARRPTGVR